MNPEVYGIAAVPVIIALVELAKRMGLNRKFSPLLALTLGLIIGFVYLAPGDYAKAAWLGVVTGLAATGLWSGAKNVAEGLKSGEEE
jgi:hypothetical protein